MSYGSNTVDVMLRYTFWLSAIMPCLFVLFLKEYCEARTSEAQGEKVLPKLRHIECRLPAVDLSNKLFYLFLNACVQSLKLFERTTLMSSKSEKESSTETNTRKIIYSESVIHDQQFVLIYNNTILYLVNRQYYNCIVQLCVPPPVIPCGGDGSIDHLK